MKTILIAAATLLLTMTAMAQENLSIGPIAGASFANLRGDVPNMDWKTGLTAGGFINYSALSGFGFSGQVLYTQLGAKMSNETNEVNLNYLQIPLLATYFFGKRGNLIRPKLFAGPHVGFLLGVKDKDGNTWVNSDGSDIYNSIDLGLTFGAGLNIRIMPKIWLNTDVRYGLGLLDAVEKNSISVYNKNWGVNLGVSFPLGRLKEPATP